MGIVRNKIRNRILSGFFAVLMIMNMGGCGKENTNVAETKTGSNGSSIVNAATVDKKECTFTENTDFSVDPSINIRKAIKVGEDIAFLSYDSHVYFMPKDSGEEKLIYTSPEETDVDYITEVDGNIGIIESKELKRTLKIVDKDGNEISSVRLSGFDDLSLNDLSCSYTVTKDGEAAVIYDRELILLDKEGKETKRVQFAYGLMSSCQTKNGEIVVFGDCNSDKVEVNVIDPKKGETVTKLLINAPYLDDGVVQTGFGDYDFFVKKDSGIYGYKIDEKNEYMICDFNESMIDGTNVKACLIRDMEDFLCVGYDSASESFKLSLYNKTDPSEEDVKTLTFATMEPTYEFQRNVTDFNKTHPDIKITLVDYSLEEDPIMKFSADVGAGKAPDIVDVTFGYGDISVNQAVQMGYLEDLTPYIAKDPDISEDDFVDSVMNASKIDGKVYYLGTSFVIDALLIKKSEIGDRTGWTYEEMMEYVYSKPDDVYPFEKKGKHEILEGFLYAGMYEFVDWEKGKCYFDSENFKALLEYSNRGTDIEKTEWDPDLNFLEDIKSGKQLFYRGYIEPTIWPLYKEFFDDDVTWIGYPDKNREGYYAMTFGNLGISSTCADKETAWEFIKFCTSKEQIGKNYTDYVGIPSRKDVFEVYMESKLATESYIDEFGNGIQVGNGTIGLGSVSVDLRPVTEEEAQEFRELTDKVSNISIEDTKMMEIINDECKSYFAGDKSVEETVKVIQDRAQNYMNESR